MSKYSKKEQRRDIQDERDWEQLLERLPAGLDLEATAEACGALQRRRAIQRASDLLRLALVYAMCDWSLRVVGLWCAVMGVGRLSDVAVRQRLMNSSRWLGVIVAAVLQSRIGHWPPAHCEQVRLVDATTISRPGSTGTDWRVHLSLDLASLSVTGVRVTDCHTGETLGHFAEERAAILVGDRGYGYARSLEAVLCNGGRLVVRINWCNLPLRTDTGSAVNIPALLAPLSAGDPLRDYPVVLHTDAGCYPLRLILAPLPQEEADRARQRVRQQARKKGRTPAAATLLAAGFVLLVTNLPSADWPAEHVLRLYRFRWQVELYFKRIKSLFQLDHLRATTPALTQTYLLAKLLMACLTDDCIQQVRLAHPDWFGTARPVSLWRLSLVFADTLTTAVRGRFSLEALLLAFPDLSRFLREPPRRRVNQAALSLAFLDRCPPLS